jgi:hypothetical protein
MSLNSLRSLWSAPLVLLLAAMNGCDRGDEIRSYSAPKDPPPVKPVEFVVPDGWRELRPQQMQYAAYAIDPEHSDATLAIVPLPREANELAPNVNRWEGRLGLPPSSAEAVQKLVNHVDVDGAHIDVVDLTGTDVANGTNQPRRMLAAIAPNGTLTWFFTLQGPPDVVEKHKANFDALVRSLKFKRDASVPAEPNHQDDDHAAPQLAMAQAKEAPHNPNDGQDHSGHEHGPPQPAAEKITWNALPAGWTLEAGERPMRVHTLFVEADGKKAEVIVSRFPQNAVGQLLENINRWRGHVGLPKTDDPSAHKPRQMTVAGTDGFAFDFDGPAQDGQPAKKQIVALTSQGNMFWFVRFIGPADLITAQQKNFEKVLTDARFDVPGGAPQQQAPATRQSQSSPSTQPSGSPR